MRSRGNTHWMLPLIITVLALADGLLHFRLDYILFRGRLWGEPSFGGPPPGAPPRGTGAPGGSAPPRGGGPPSPLPLISLPLNELFLLNFIGFIVLAVIFWIVLRTRPAWIWVVDIVLILYTLASIIGWVRIGMPNPQGLGYLAKGLEIALIVALVAHLATLFGQRSMRISPA